MALETSERYHQAVVERDASYDRTFVTAVKTTGIFCKPSCSSRTPKRENVTFFPDPESARAAGFRACKRCRPEVSDPSV